MNLIRALLFENLGLKLVAILLALAVYLHVYTERPATMVVSFPIELTDLADSLSFSGELPAAVRAELRGTGKQIIRLRLTEPRLKISLAGIDAGHFTRRVTMDDLPVMASDRLRIERLVGPNVVEVDLERKIGRHVPVAARIVGVLPAGVTWSGEVLTDPETVLIRGPRTVVGALDSVRLVPVRIDARSDTLRAEAELDSLPAWCTADPARVTVRVPFGRTKS